MSRENWTDDKLLFRLVNNKSDKARWENIGILRKRPGATLFAKCVELTKSSNPKLRSIGVDILAQFGLPPRPFLKETLKLYFNLLNTEADSNVIGSLLYAINHNNDNLNKTQIERLCSFSDSDNTRIKEGLVFALLGIDNPNAITTLIKLSSDRNSFIRNWATFGIGTQVTKNNNTIRTALWERINDKHQETKLEAIVGLAKRKDNRVNEIIEQELMVGEYGTLLFDAIIETQNKRFLPLLRHSLKLIKDDRSINPAWKKDLQDCIHELAQLTR